MPDRPDVPRSAEFWSKLLKFIDAELLEPHAPPTITVQGPELGKVVELPTVLGLHHRYGEAA